MQMLSGFTHRDFLCLASTLFLLSCSPPGLHPPIRSHLYMYLPSMVYLCMYMMYVCMHACMYDYTIYSFLTHTHARARAHTHTHTHTLTPRHTHRAKNSGRGQRRMRYIAGASAWRSISRRGHSSAVPPNTTARVLPPNTTAHSNTFNYRFVSVCLHARVSFVQSCGMNGTTQGRGA
jgi:hypothetical protein